MPVFLLELELGLPYQGGRFGFTDLANFCFGFSVFARIKTAAFQFQCLARFAGFLLFIYYVWIFENGVKELDPKPWFQ